ncbi:CASP-like protein 5B1 [Asparagus officinalis]|uniref:CASP-like protein 5B1 n=1 Tax=Asparagus officinalis TaxID=4686 RepID=UPI00098DF8D4|nr:CASP-like protein 5B1 [Asparagus officinalis]
MNGAGLERATLTCLAVADWIAAGLLLGSACFAAGPTIYFLRDIGRCKYMVRDCNLTFLSIGSALIAWCCIVTPLYFILSHFFARRR